MMDTDGARSSTKNLNCDRRTTLGEEIRELLGGFRGTHSLKRLFWELLGYERRDEVILFSGSSPFRSSVIEARLLASHEAFHIYYVTMASEFLTRPLIRQVCRYFQMKHRYVAVLVSDVTQTRWHLCYLANVPTANHSRACLVTMALGSSDENLRRQAVRLTRLKTYDANDDPVDQLELVAAYDEAFTVLQPQTNDRKRALDDVHHLLETIGRHPLLSARQERSIFVELDEISDTLEINVNNRRQIVRVADPIFADRYEELRGQLVLHNQRLCFHFAKKYSRNYEDLFDLFQEAVIGLFRAIDKFDIGRNLKFSTYASLWIKQRIRNYVWYQRSIVRMPRPSRHLPERERHEFSIIPLEDGNDDHSRDLVDGSLQVPSFEMEQGDRARLIDEALQTLKDRDASILAERFGLKDSRRKTLEEIGNERNLTKERIRQLESRALGQLRCRLDIIGQDMI